MKELKSRLIISSVFILLSSLLPLTVKSQDAKSGYFEKLALVNSMVGKPAPAFTAKTLTGTAVSNQELAGKVVVVNFWFVGCPPCEEEMPLLNKLIEKYEDKTEIVFLSFCNTDKEGIAKFFSGHEFKYQTVPSAREIAKTFNVSAFPTNFIIDKQGLIRFTSIGGQDDIDTYLSENINAVLKKPVL